MRDDLLVAMFCAPRAGIVAVVGRDGRVVSVGANVIGTAPVRSAVRSGGAESLVMKREKGIG